MNGTQPDDAVVKTANDGDEESGEEEESDQPSEMVAVPSTKPKLGSARRPSKRFSVVAAEGNPLAQGKAGAKLAPGKVVSLKVESTTDARPITESELAEAVTKIQSYEENADVLTYIESSKSEFTYSSADLLAILKSITSIKTRMSIVEALAPRITDPKRCQAEILELFRFNNDKETIEGLLRARSQALNSEMFKKTEGLGTSSVAASSPVARSPGPGGRGFGLGAGRSPGRGVGSPQGSISTPVRSIFRSANEVPSPLLSAAISESAAEPST